MGGTCAVREGPGKQKPRSCRAWELARSSAPQNARQKKGRLTELGENAKGVLADGTTGEIRGSSELQASVKCDHARRTVTAQTDPKQARRRRHRVSQCAKPRLRGRFAGNAAEHVAGQAKVWMVEDVEELPFDSEL